MMMWCAVQEVDLLLLQWNVAYMKLERAETTYEAAGLLKRPEHNLRCCGCTGMTLHSQSSLPILIFPSHPRAAVPEPRIVLPHTPTNTSSWLSSYMKKRYTVWLAYLTPRSQSLLRPQCGCWSCFSCQADCNKRKTAVCGLTIALVRWIG